MEAKKPANKSWRLWALIITTLTAIGLVGYGALHAREIINTVDLMTTHSPQFPLYANGELTTAQQKLVDIIKTEYQAQPSGTKYSEGITEPWCADFVSWVARANGTPLTNPHSGSWRIPGTVTLRDYFKQKGNWHPYGDGYVPKVGDIAIYDGNGPHGQHTNFVLAYANGILTTVGGNEAGAIHRQDHTLNDDLKVIGFAEL